MRAGVVRGLAAACAASGVVMFGHGLLLIAMGPASLRSHFDEALWPAAVVPAVAAVVLAVPATIVGWSFIRRLPSRLANFVNVALLGGILGIGTLLTLALAMSPLSGWQAMNRELAIAACLSGLGGASAGWFAGLRREVRTD